MIDKYKYYQDDIDYYHIMSKMSLEILLTERDILERIYKFMGAKVKIERNDELDYEIERILRA